MAEQDQLRDNADLDPYDSGSISSVNEFPV